MDYMELTRRGGSKSRPDAAVEESVVKYERDNADVTYGSGQDSSGLKVRRPPSHISLIEYTDAAHEQRFIRFLPIIMFIANLQLSWISLGVSFQAGLFNGGQVCCFNLA